MSSVLQKVIMSVTGLAWFGFLVSHLGANLLMYGDAATYNSYPESLRAFGPLLYVAEAGLAVLLASHIAMAFRTGGRNLRARSTGYHQRRTTVSTFASRTMLASGVLLFIYIPFHIWQFKFGNWSGVDGLWGLVATSFQELWVVLLYVLASLAVVLHLSHGLSSALQTLGFGPKSLRRRLGIVGVVMGWSFGIGFASIPIWCYDALP